MEDKPQSKIKEALRNKLINKNNSINSNKSSNIKDNKLKQSFTKRNKIRTDSIGKRAQNRGD